MLAAPLTPFFLTPIERILYTGLLQRHVVSALPFQGLHSKEVPDNKHTIMDKRAVTTAKGVLKGTCTVWPTRKAQKLAKWRWERTPRELSRQSV